MKTTANAISTKMRNLMSQYVGKSFNYFYGGRQYMWTVKVIGVMDNGYFITEVNDGESTWQSNASYGEVTCNIKKGFFLSKHKTIQGSGRPLPPSPEYSPIK